MMRSGFQKGHKYSTGTAAAAVVSDASPVQNTSRKFLRLGKSEYDLVVKSSSDHQQMDIPDCDGDAGSTCILRPRKTVTSAGILKVEDNCEYFGGSRVIDIQKHNEAITKTMQLHQNSGLECTNPNIVINSEKKMGLAWTCSMKCTSCNFVTPEFKLFREVRKQINERGPRPSAANVALAVATQDTAIGAERAIEFLTCLDLPAPNKSVFTRHLNKVGQATKELNEADMHDKILKVKEVNEARGNAPNIMNISVDGRYNSTRMFDRNTPGHNASQAFALAVEHNTDRNYIIACATQNKLCWTGAWLKGKGIEVDCPGGHAECTANVNRPSAFSEYVMGKDIGTQLALQNVLVRYVITDGDGRSAKGVEDGIKSLYPLWNTERQADPVHLGQAQFRASNRAQYSSDMFYAKTKEDNGRLQKVFSNDIKSRCSMVMKKLMTTHAGNVEKVGKCLPKVLDATIKCYDGDCSMCKVHSVVCNGGTVDNWWNFSRNLATYSITSLKMNDNDKKLLTEILKMKLSVEALNSMKLNASTNINESLHRSASASLPKNVNFGRNMEGRLHSVIHRYNNLPGTSTKKKCEHLGVDHSTKSLMKLDRLDEKCKYHKNYARRPSVVIRKQIRIGQLHAESKEYKNKQKCDYKKGQLDPKLKNGDHKYCKF